MLPNPAAYGLLPEEPDTSGRPTMTTEALHLPSVGLDSTTVDNPTPSRRRRRTSRIPVHVGLDVASVSEVGDAVQRFGDHYVNRVFTRREAAYCRAAAEPVAAARFAARFAAKEAAFKALQVERGWIDWREIEVRRRRSGRCALVLHRTAAALAARLGIEHLALSMTHEGDLAAAVVVAVCSQDRTRPERRRVQNR
jgi:holo-[acyl-carrier protein] synthase